MCAVRKRLVFKTAAIIRLTSRSTASVKLHPSFLGDQDAVFSSFSGVGVALSEAVLGDWTPVDSRLRAMRLRFLQSKQSSL